MQQMTLGSTAIEPCEAQEWPLDPDWKIDDPRGTRQLTSSPTFGFTLNRAVFYTALMIAPLVLLFFVFLVAR
jgi:hypothetical protein